MVMIQNKETIIFTRVFVHSENGRLMLNNK